MDQIILKQLQEIKTALANLVTKDELRSELRNELANYPTKSDLREELAKYATKDDLKSLSTKADLVTVKVDIIEDLAEVIRNFADELYQKKADKTTVVHLQNRISVIENKLVPH